MKARRDGAGSVATPVDDGELDTLFAGWPRYPRIALAVSGGADSLALMHLAHRWAARTPDPPQFAVLTVDHGLRPASAAEAEGVKAQAAALGLDHHTLVWQGAKPATGIQAKARAARYALMCEFCRAHGTPALATAHTADDQAETLLMRLARGSGVDGLAGMATATALGGIDILRPLLALTRTRLEAHLTADGLQWVNDPSNDDDHYERVRIRRALRADAACGLTVEALAVSARRLRRARAAIETMTTRFLDEALTVHAAGFGELALAVLFGIPEEIALNALSRLVHAFGQQSEPPRLTKFEAANALLRAGGRGTTLGGCRLVVRRDKLLVVREFGRVDAGVVTHSPGELLLWDGRFTVAPPSSLSGKPRHATPVPLTVRPLGPDGLAAIKDMGGGIDGVPRIAALALPSLWQAARLRFAPFVLWSQGEPPGWLSGCGVRFMNAGLLRLSAPRLPESPE